MSTEDQLTLEIPAIDEAVPSCCFGEFQLTGTHHGVTLPSLETLRSEPHGRERPTSKQVSRIRTFPQLEESFIDASFTGTRKRASRAKGRKSSLSPMIKVFL